MSTNRMRHPAAVMSALVLLVGCGADTSSPSDSSADASAPRASYGVDSVDWPNTLEDARSVFSALPDEVAGEQKEVRLGKRRLDGYFGSVEDTWVWVHAVPEKEDPGVALATYASFNSCDSASLAGNSPLDGETSGHDGDVWLSCDLVADAEEGTDRPGGHVLGWTSGSVVWWVEAPNRQTVVELVSPMMDAASDLPGDGPGTRTPDTADSAPYRIEDVAWPTTLEPVARIALPTLDGHRGRWLGPQGGMLSAEYPSGDLVVVSQAQEGLGASAMLAALFGLVYSCERGTFQGSAMGIDGGHAARPPSESTLRWFTCEVKGAEGDPSFRGSAVGWASGGLAWLVVATTERRSQKIVDVLVAAG